MALNEDNGDMSVKQAGQKGGERTKETHDHEFYSKIGQKGGEVGGKKVKDLIERGKKAEDSE